MAGWLSMRWSRAGLRFFCVVLFFSFLFTSIPLANYSVHPIPPHPLGGPRSRNTAGGRNGPIDRWSRTPGSHRGGRSGCKTKHCWGLGGAGSVSPSKSGRESVYYYSAVQYSWSIQPRETRSRGRRGCWAVPVHIWVFFFLPKVGLEVSNRNITGSASQLGC